jgi:uncharacterized membrane protein YbhN (UPF0104 family)
VGIADIAYGRLTVAFKSGFVISQGLASVGEEDKGIALFFCIYNIAVLAGQVSHGSPS